MLPANSERARTDRTLPAPARLALARLHPRALGTALGCVVGGWAFAVTLWTALTGDTAARRALGLVSQYWPGFRVTPWGSVVGLLYGLVVGFVAGFIVAGARNAVIRLYVTYLRRRAEQQQLNDILDRLG